MTENDTFEYFESQFTTRDNLKHDFWTLWDHPDGKTIVFFYSTLAAFVATSVLGVAALGIRDLIRKEPAVSPQQQQYERCVQRFAGQKLIDAPDIRAEPAEVLAPLAAVTHGCHTAVYGRITLEQLNRQLQTQQ